MLSKAHMYALPSRFAMMLMVSALVLFTGCGDDDDGSDTSGSSNSTSNSTSNATSNSTSNATSNGTGTEMNIVEVATDNGSFGVLVAAVAEAELVATLSGTDEYTVFAPTDAAFQTYLTDNNLTQEDLLANPALGDILLYHVVAGEVTSDMLTDGMTVTTAAMEDLTINTTGGVTLDDGTGRTITVTMPDVQASNGVIHVIDMVLLPPSIQ
ncbi:MAG: fasciclin domain-containing protein [Myxococcota bacterium]